MKKILFLIFLSFLPFLGISQTFPLHDVDDCKLLVGGFEQEADYLGSVPNPDSNDSSVNVSNISYVDNPNQNAPVSSVFFFLPQNIQAGTVIDWSARFYSANPGSAGSGSGQLRIQLLNNSLGASLVASLGDFDKVGGSWQTESGTNVTLSTPDDAAVNAAGGFDVIRIFNSTDTSLSNLEDLFFDNVELSVNLYPFLADEDADLQAGNSWVYNNRPGDNKFEAISNFNVTPTYSVPTPSTAGNSATETIQVAIESGFSVQRYPITPIDPPFSGSVSLRLYVETCNLPYVNNIRIGLRKDNDATTSYDSPGSLAVNVPANIWTEAVIDLNDLTPPGSPATGYNELLIIYDQGDNGAATGTNYFIDAIQVPNGNLSSNDFDSSQIDVYMTSKDNLRIEGIENGEVKVRMYNILAKHVMSTSFQANGNKDILLNEYNPGVYFVQILTERGGKISKKIILR
jgi:hypothetical protein